MAGEYPQRLRAICAPQASCSISGGSGEVITRWTECNVPYRTAVGPSLVGEGEWGKEGNGKRGRSISGGNRQVIACWNERLFPYRTAARSKTTEKGGINGGGQGWAKKNQKRSAQKAAAKLNINQTNEKQSKTRKEIKAYNGNKNQNIDQNKNNHNKQQQIHQETNEQTTNKTCLIRLLPSPSSTSHQCPS